MNAILLLLTLVSADYSATIERVKDGDTFVATIHLGFDVDLAGQEVRIRGFDAWEISRRRKTVKLADDELARGRAAKAELASLLAGAKEIAVEPGKPLRDVYGRLLLVVKVDGKDVGELMRAKGHERK